MGYVSQNFFKKLNLVSKFCNQIFFLPILKLCIVTTVYDMRPNFGVYYTKIMHFPVLQKVSQAMDEDQLFLPFSKSLGRLGWQGWVVMSKNVKKPKSLRPSVYASTVLSPPLHEHTCGQIFNDDVTIYSPPPQFPRWETGKSSPK